MLYDDTIAAIATPVGEGGIGIIRLSGQDALPILQRLFKPRRATARYIPQRMLDGRLLDQTGQPVDEGLAVYFRAPHSDTRRMLSNCTATAGALPLRRTLEAALPNGARLAEPGEFTLRAIRQRAARPRPGRGDVRR